MYAESARDHGTDCDTFIYCAVNAYWEERVLRLPELPAGFGWSVIAYTGDSGLSGSYPWDTVTLMSRSVMLLVGRKI
jgi:glycogen operon protein